MSSADWNAVGTVNRTPCTPYGRKRTLDAQLDAIFFARVLIADECPRSADSWVRLVGARGCNAMTLESARDLLACALAFEPDVIFLDRATLGAAGRSILRSVRASPALDSVWIVVIGGPRRCDLAAFDRQAGVDGQIVQPIDLAALDSILATVRSEVRQGDGTAVPRHGAAFTRVDAGRYRFPVIWGGLPLMAGSAASRPRRPANSRK